MSVSTYAKRSLALQLRGMRVRDANCSVSSTVRVGRRKTSSSCAQKPTICCMSPRVAAEPLMVMLPLSGAKCPRRQCSSVLLPLPLPPMIAVSLPDAALPLTPCNMHLPPSDKHTPSKARSTAGRGAVPPWHAPLKPQAVRMWETNRCVSSEDVSCWWKGATLLPLSRLRA